LKAIPPITPCRQAWRGRIDSRGSLYQFSYTWSKALALQGVQGLIGQGATDVFSDNLDPRRDYGPTGFNRPQMFTGSVIYVLPGLKGANAIERGALGGWSIEPVMAFTSGVPVVPTTGADLWGTGTNQDRPNRVPGQSCRAHGTGIESQWLNPKAFSLYGIPLGTDGNASLGDCYGPGENNWDIALHKDFKISDRLNVQFRFEFFNAFNKTQFEGVNGGLGGAQACFGDVNGNGAAVNPPTTNASSPLSNDNCYLLGNPYQPTNHTQRDDWALSGAERCVSDNSWPGCQSDDRRRESTQCHSALPQFHLGIGLWPGQLYAPGPADSVRPQIYFLRLDGQIAAASNGGEAQTSFASHYFESDSSSAFPRRFPGFLFPPRYLRIV
jgi:hypothetical protein